MTEDKILKRIEKKLNRLIKKDEAVHRKLDKLKKTKRR